MIHGDFAQIRPLLVEGETDRLRIPDKRVNTRLGYVSRGLGALRRLALIAGDDSDATAGRVQ
jgi:hypothetical protein